MSHKAQDGLNDKELHSSKCPIAEVEKPWQLDSRRELRELGSVALPQPFSLSGV